jgi:hypothetical protein
LGAAGQPAKRLRTGDAVTVHLHYATDVPIEDPVFGIGIDRVDGAEVCGRNTRETAVVIERVTGEGCVDLHIDSLPLLPATYDLSAALYNHTLSRAYDHRHHAFRFDVEPGPDHSGTGLIALEGSWDVK